MPYGIANASGQVTPEEVGRILRKAKECGISTLDTAVVYGESEKVLGAAGVEDFNVISKLPPLPKGDLNVAAWVDGHVAQSLDRLRLSRLDGLLLHRPQDLQGRQGLPWMVSKCMSDQYSYRGYYYCRSISYVKNSLSGKICGQYGMTG